MTLQCWHTVKPKSSQILPYFFFRKVRINATEVVRNMCTTRKLGLCKDFMMQLSSYLVPSLEQESLTSLSKMAAASNPNIQGKPRFDEERHMWMGLEKFIDMTRAVIFREGICCRLSSLFYQGKARFLWYNIICSLVSIFQIRVNISSLGNV